MLGDRVWCALCCPMDFISCHIGNSIGHHCFCNRTSSWTHTPALRMCAHSLKDLLDSGGVCTGWMKVYVWMCMCVLDVVLKFICSCQCHIEQRFTYELYGAVKRWWRSDGPLISQFSSFSTTPTFSPLPEFSLLWTLGV